MVKDNVKNNHCQKTTMVNKTTMVQQEYQKQSLANQ